MIEKAMAIVSSCIRRLSSTSGSSSPSTRMTGCEPTLMCRSDARRSAAIFSRSLICTGSPQIVERLILLESVRMTSLQYVLRTPTGRDDSSELPLVIVLHGRGADANDLSDLAPYLGPDFRFVFPNAPKPFEPMPGYSFGFTWFDGWPAERKSLLESRTLLLTFLDEIVAKYPTPRGKAILCGFS